jgi:diguanylate cyclase (GGDEF)-like protein
VTWFLRGPGDSTKPGEPWRPRAQRDVLYASACILFVGLVAEADYLTGVEIRIYPLYFVPVALGAWQVSRRIGLLLAALSAGGWLASNLLASGDEYTASVWGLNTSVQALTFAVVALLIAELRRRLEVERELGRKDPLTLLPNSRAFYERAELLLAGARRSGRPFTIAYLDLDNFKSVNDQHGHREGDSTLKTVAEILLRHTRKSDLVARLGGDEFVIYLPDTGPEAAGISLERIRDLLAAAMRDKGWLITLSVGAVCFARAPATLEQAVQGADSLMYAAKQAGKDRVHIRMDGALPAALP